MSHNRALCLPEARQIDSCRDIQESKPFALRPEAVAYIDTRGRAGHLRSLSGWKA